MDSKEFRKWGTEMVNFVADYWDNLRDRTPIPNVEPGDICKLIPAEPPLTPDSWESIFKDLNPIVMNGSTHWQHPHFFAYFPTPNSYPSIIGDILSGALGTVGFSWISSPACTEVELVVMDWLARMLKLPEIFFNSHPGPGAGVIQSTASDATLLCILAARTRMVSKLTDKSNNKQPVNFFRLVAYCSDQAHSSVEKAAILAGLTLRQLGSDHNFSLRGPTLEKAIEEDLKHHLIPIVVIASLGTTNTCGYDNLKELALICEKHKVWLHVDAAYAGSAFICPEYRHILNGVELVDSFNFNPHKMLQVTFDCSALWFRDSKPIENAFSIDASYLHNENHGPIPDLRNLEVPLGRRFRALKLWFVIRTYGVTGLQEHVRFFCRMAKIFQRLVESDNRYTIVAPVHLGLVVFRYNGSNEVNEQIVKCINEDKRIYLVPATLRGLYVIRFAICSTITTEKDIIFAWNVIQEITDKVVGWQTIATSHLVHLSHHLSI